ncbi:RAMP superfamily CRISPR-associated protein [Paenibacillus chartarius]|uniref:RAMP superfamily CRISPR-associated protein n=1 Tax=Paenibacillus chartarius TaxID=747481 RepID=A0ABV6DTM7_9BACL
MENQDKVPLFKRTTFVGEWRVDIASDSVWRVKNGDELLYDENGKPWIPGTTIAGALRKAASTMEFAETKAVGEMFGYLSLDGTNRDVQSSLYVYDAEVNESLSTISEEIRPSVSLNPVTGNAANRKRFEREYMSPGIVLTFGLRLFARDEEDYERKRSLVANLLAALHHGTVRFGGDLSNGAGRFHIRKIHHMEYDLRSKADLLSYASSLQIGGTHEITEQIIGNGHTHAFYKVQLDVHIPAVLIGAQDNSSNKTDTANMRTDHGQTSIIPGSSLKGLLRHQATRIAFARCSNEATAEQLVDFLFGADNSTTGERPVAGHVFIGDVRIRNEASTVITGIRMNKLTSTGMKGGMFTSERIAGEGTIEIILRPARTSISPFLEHAAMTLLLFAIRDLAFGHVNIGGGGARGFGRLSAQQLTMTHREHAVVVTHDGKVTGSKAFLLDNLLHAWREVTKL